MNSVIYILGTGGFAREVAQLIRQIDPQSTKWRRIAFVTDQLNEVGRHMSLGLVEMTDDDLLKIDSIVDVVIGIGIPVARKILSQKFSSNGVEVHFPNLIHPSVELDTTAVKVGIGNIICKGVVLTCDIDIGNHNVFNLNATVGHDAKIGSFNVINPSVNISGYVSVGQGCLLGTGVQVLEKISVADGTKVGAGAVVVKDIILPGMTYVGIPARPLL